MGAGSLVCSSNEHSEPHFDDDKDNFLLSDKGMSSWYIGKEQFMLLALPPSSFQMQSKFLHLISRLIKHFWQAAFLLRLCFPWLCRLLPSEPSNPCAKFILQFSFPSIKHLLNATGTAFSVSALSVELLVFTKCFIHKVVHMFNFHRQIMVQLFSWLNTDWTSYGSLVAAAPLNSGSTCILSVIKHRTATQLMIYGVISAVAPHSSPPRTTSPQSMPKSGIWTVTK